MTKSFFKYTFYHQLRVHVYIVIIWQSSYVLGSLLEPYLFYFQILLFYSKSQQIPAKNNISVCYLQVNTVTQGKFGQALQHDLFIVLACSMTMVSTMARNLVTTMVTTMISTMTILW